ncbi:hypothetical protein [Albibacillus kandeliae]|uniref:hypothetical protein n=1 Tax=Albibacillus kandeliae TaxID=2174228 RepID=UPI000D6961C7|nr:hypothetical protein [Albibacillus kandeliae]
MKLILAFGLALSVLVHPAQAQEVSEVHFAPGTSGATLNGAVRGDDYFDYHLGARAGQLLIASLEVTDSNGDGTAYFNILPPGSSGEAIWIGNMEAEQTAEVQLPSDGTYTLRVYLMGNDKDSEKTVGYALHVNIQ